MKRLITMVVSLASIATGASTVDAGIENEELRIDSDVTGTTYQIRYSCAAAKLQTFVRTDTGRSVTLRRTLSGPNDGSFGSTRTFNGFDRSKPRVLSLSSNTADRWSLEEGNDEDSLVRIAGADIDCPDYSSPSPSVFVPITPTRVLDTRPETRTNFAGPMPEAQATIDIDQSDLPDLPADAVAVSATVTVTEAAQPGFVQLLPTGSTPGGSSNVNPQYAGHTLANNAVAPLSSGGVSVYTHRSTHVVVDVNGYFVEAPNATQSGRYQHLPVTDRVIDTRPASAVNHSTGIVEGGTALTIPVTDLAGLGSDPVGAVAINVTATETSDAGFLQSAATGSLDPGASSIVNPTRPNDTVAAMTIVPVSPNGEIDIYTASDSHVIVDVLGWFTDATAPSSTTGRFVPLEPERILDTRLDDSPVNCCFPSDYPDFDESSGRRNPGARTTAEVPAIDRAGADTVMVNLTAVDATGAGFFQVGAASGFVDGASSTVNATRAGDIVSNAAVVGLGQPEGGPTTAAFQVYTQSGGHVVADVAGYFTE